MHATARRISGNLATFFQPPIPGTPEEVMERALRTWAAKVRGRDGKVPSRAFYDWAEGYQAPFRVITRRVQEADRRRVPPELLLELREIFGQYLEAKATRRCQRRSVA